MGERDALPTGALYVTLILVLVGLHGLQLTLHARSKREGQRLSARLHKLEHLLGEDDTTAGSVVWTSRRHEFGEPGPTLGTPVPAFTLRSLAGTELTPTLLVGTPALLLTLSGLCGSCRLFLDKLLAYIDTAALPLDLPPTLVLLSDQVLAPDIDEAAADGVRLFQAQIPVDHSLLKALGVTATPHAVLLDAAGVVLAEGFVADIEHLRRGTRDKAVSTNTGRRALAAGELA